jgi:hypothetical protein
VRHKERFGIDGEQIYLAGSSAGGIVALTTAFMDGDEVYASADGKNAFRQIDKLLGGMLVGVFGESLDKLPEFRENLGGLDESGNDFKERFKIAGVVSMWGGVTDLTMLDNNRIPTLLFHGTADNIVPCNEGLPFKDTMGKPIHGFLSLFGKIYGSEPIYAKLKSLNVPATYIPFCDAGHDPTIESDGTLNQRMDTVCAALGDFLYDNVSEHHFNYLLYGKTAVGKIDAAQIYRLENLEKNDIVQWNVAGGFITDANRTNGTIRVVWYSGYKNGTVTACITNKNGSCKKTLKISCVN